MEMYPSFENFPVLISAFPFGSNTMTTYLSCLHTSHGSYIVYDTSASFPVATQKNLYVRFPVLFSPGVDVGAQLKVFPESDTSNVMLSLRMTRQIRCYFPLVALEISASTDI